MSFVLIKSLLGRPSQPLLNKIKSLMRKGDKIYSIDDNSLLAVLPNASSNEAAGFVRQLRNKADKEILMKPLTALNSASFAFLSSVVTFPEDGHELQTVLGKAREALTTTRRLGVS
jgi:GGDEF domain-containing protein